MIGPSGRSEPFESGSTTAIIDLNSSERAFHLAAMFLEVSHLPLVNETGGLTRSMHVQAVFYGDRHLLPSQGASTHESRSQGFTSAYSPSGFTFISGDKALHRTIAKRVYLLLKTETQGVLRWVLDCILSEVVGLIPLAIGCSSFLGSSVACLR